MRDRFSSSAWSTRWMLIAIFALALLLRLGWASLQTSDREAALMQALPDQREYLAIARHLLREHILYFHDLRFDAVVFAYRMPGYPLFIALCGGDWRLVRVAQAALDASLVIAAYLISRRWIDDNRAVMVAVGLVAINPFLIYFTSLLLSETLFIAMIAWAIALIARRWTIAAIALIALSTLVRPEAILLPAMLGAIGAWVNWRGDASRAKTDDPSPNLSPSTGRGERSVFTPLPVRGERLGEGRSRIRQAVLYSLLGITLTILALAPWAYRNHRVLGQWVWTTSNSGFTMYDGFNPRATGGSDQSFATDDSPIARNLFLMNSEMTRSRYLNNLADIFIRENPGRVWTLAWLKTARTWSPIPLSREFGGDWIRVIVAAIYSTTLFTLTLVGLWRRSLPLPAKVLLISPAIYLTIVHAMTVGSLRYRLPAELPMAVIAASALGIRR